MTPGEVAAILERQVQQLDDLEHTVADLLTSQGAAGSAVLDEPAAPFRWSSLPEFVEHVIAPLYAAHLVTGGGWCEQWYEHVEARIRLGAVWRAWETLRLDPHVGMARWLRDAADPQMDRLRGPSGPFRACGDRHLVPAPLPLRKAPATFWAELTLGDG